jgi:hypothetical protein
MRQLSKTNPQYRSDYLNISKIKNKNYFSFHDKFSVKRGE